MRFRKKPVVIEAIYFVGFDSPNGVALHIPVAVKEFINLPVIRGIKGELYPCKPDIFAATYEAAE